MKKKRQAGAELGQTQYKHGLDFNLLFCRFSLVELVRQIEFVGLIEQIWFGIFGSVYLVLHISNVFLGRFDFVDTALQIWFGIFGSIDLAQSKRQKFGSVAYVLYIGQLVASYILSIEQTIFDFYTTNYTFEEVLKKSWT